MKGRVLLSVVVNESDYVQDQEVISRKTSRSLFAATKVDQEQYLEETSEKMSRSLSAAMKADPGQALEVGFEKKI